MFRRSFLQAVGAAVAAAFAPTIAAKTNADYLVDPNKWFIKPGDEASLFFDHEFLIQRSLDCECWDIFTAARNYRATDLYLADSGMTISSYVDFIKRQGAAHRPWNSIWNGTRPN